MDLAELYSLVTQGHYEFSAHAQRERLADDLDVIEIEQALLNGEILEQYPSDRRGESCLVLGFSGARPIHVVLGWAMRGPEEDSYDNARRLLVLWRSGRGSPCHPRLPATRKPIGL